MATNLKTLKFIYREKKERKKRNTTNNFIILLRYLPNMLPRIINYEIELSLSLFKRFEMDLYQFVLYFFSRRD